jgi:gamma-glutamylcyclotransferase (GGCT)/AIG2-like uncharacterized protein YtfP
MSYRAHFAYGSNLDIERMHERTGAVREPRLACLHGYRLAFNKLGNNGTGKGNIVPSAGRKVWGVIYQCTDDELAKLDRKEGVRLGHYTHVTVEVESDSKWIQVDTFVAGQAYLHAGLLPAADYLARIIKGARHHGLPEDYIAEIERIAKCSVT